MPFSLDPISLGKLRGVHPDLIRVVQRCAENAALPFTFGVSEGLRTLQQQKLDVAAGKSQTMNSRHLDGHAVDLVVLVHGQITWSWPPYYVLADAMRQASVDTRIPLVWGGVWNREMADYTKPAAAESAQYVSDWHAAHPDGKSAFTDGPHFELPRDKYLSGAYTPGIRTA